MYMPTLIYAFPPTVPCQENLLLLCVMIFSSACQVPHKPVGEKPARVAERVAAEQQKRNQSYKLVLTDEEDEDDSHEAVAKVLVSFIQFFLSL